MILFNAHALSQVRWITELSVNLYASGSSTFGTRSKGFDSSVKEEIGCSEKRKTKAHLCLNTKAFVYSEIRETKNNVDFDREIQRTSSLDAEVHTDVLSLRPNDASDSEIKHRTYRSVLFRNFDKEILNIKISWLTIWNY